MTRDGLLQQIANEFEFDLTEEIKVGGNYRPVVVDENVAYISGQIPRVGDVVRFAGVVGDDISIEDARRAAAIAALRALALVLKQCGSLELISAVPRITVFVRSSPDFIKQSEVADGASDVLYAVLGDVGVHTRTSVGVAQLPKGASVEIDFIFRLKPS
ncbi:RidA family protein [Paraburkholderia sp. LEh10]|uniref:RidA family protein n=1 Tax=Paraburkholderia sp. LEh10 TaxID=2821353 RepID=UPI001AE82018|nr:RidA family protein [Paraburkholderia sp. LEh10]MBP0590389.1 RidA family protein [Paraburkholderia sp. LEh10]